MGRWVVVNVDVCSVYLVVYLFVSDYSGASGTCNYSRYDIVQGTRRLSVSITSFHANICTTCNRWQQLIIITHLQHNNTYCIILLFSYNNDMIYRYISVHIGLIFTLNGFPASGILVYNNIFILWYIYIYIYRKRCAVVLAWTGKTPSI